MNFFLLNSLGSFTPILQIVSIFLLLLITATQQYAEAKKSGKMYGAYPPSIRLIFVPIYEEVIFRGLLFGGLLILLPTIYALAVSSIFFGIWHLKNLRWDNKKRVLGQILWAGVVLGPAFALLTLWTKSISLAIILHYVNNIWASTSENLFKRFS